MRERENFPMHREIFPMLPQRALTNGLKSRTKPIGMHAASGREPMSVRAFPFRAVATLVLLGAPAAAETEEVAQPRAVSMAEALTFARTHQPQIRAARARVVAERAQADVARGQWMPTVGVTAQVFGATANNTTTAYVGRPLLDVPSLGGTRSASASTANLAPYASTFAGLGGTQELFDFGRIAAQSAAADALVEARKLDAEAERLDVELDVEEAFFALQAAKAVLLASDGAYERARVHRDLARAGVQSGLRPPIELTRAEADLQRFEIGRIRARGGVAVGQSVFAVTVGSTEAALDAGAGPETPADMPALAAAIQQASARDPHLRATLAKLQAQEERTRAIGAEQRPDLSLTATVSGRAGGAAPSSGSRADFGGWLPTVPNWDVGVVFSWPLFDGTVSARQAASRAQEDLRREELAVAKQSVAAKVQQAYVEVDVARATLPGLKRALDAAVANYAQADARFKSGLGTSVELADAEELRARTEIDLAIGTFKLARARASFGRAIAEGL
jgi:outer membrane protein